jgi:hypothetical protein
MTSHKLMLAAGLTLLGMGGVAQAAIIDPLLDPLHSVVCAGPGGTNCVNTDAGSFAPLGQSSNWGFEISPGPATGDLTLAILVPTNQITVSSYLLPTLTDNGGSPLTESIGSRTTLLTSANGNNPGPGGGLSFYLEGQHLLATPPGTSHYKPTDSFDNASAGEATENPLFTGSFLAFSVKIPNITLEAQGSPTIANDFSFGANVPAGTVIVGFFDCPTCNQEFVGTAASEDLVTTPRAAPPVPIPGAALLFGSGLIGLIALGRRKTKRNDNEIYTA